MSVRVSEVMTNFPHTIGSETSISKASEFMREYSCRHLPVLDGGRLVGIISDRDLNLLEKTQADKSTVASEIMSEDPVVVAPDTDLDEAVKTMLSKNINSLIVSASEESPWGILTSTDALRYFVNK